MTRQAVASSVDSTMQIDHRPRVADPGGMERVHHFDAIEHLLVAWWAKHPSCERAFAAESDEKITPLYESFYEAEHNGYQVFKETMSPIRIREFLRVSQER